MEGFTYFSGMKEGLPSLKEVKRSNTTVISSIFISVEMEIGYIQLVDLMNFFSGM